MYNKRRAGIQQYTLARVSIKQATTSIKVRLTKNKGIGGSMMNALKKTRKSLKSQLSRFKTYVEEHSQEEIQELKVRLEKAETLWDKFEDTQTAIENLDEKEETHRKPFEDTYFEVVAKARQKIEQRSSELNTSSASLNPTTATNTNSIKVKLPTITLTNFSGKYSEWLMYRDSFQSIIDKNEDLTNVQKLQYLRGSLQDEALQIIQALETTDENYQIAWNLLKQRYENEQLIINTHIKALFDLPQATKESRSTLRHFIDQIRTNISALKTLKEPVEQWNTVLIYLFNSKLDWRTKQQWQEKLSVKDKSKKPTLETFLEFLSNKCQTLEMTEKPANQESSNKPHPIRRNAYVTTNSQASSCASCGAQHPLFKCEEFLKLSASQRQDEVRKLKLCLNCFKAGHYGRECKSSSSCKKCHKRHNTLLHEDNKKEKMEENIDHSITETKTATTIVNNHSVQQHEEYHTILPTATVFIKDKCGKMHKVRALLDSGSQSNFITRELVKKLELSCRKTNISVFGINQGLSKISESTQLTMMSRYSNYSTTMECLILEKITNNLPQLTLNKANLKLPNHIKLADDNFDVTAKIDLLIGSEIFWNILCANQIRFSRDKPILQETKLGWVVAGSVNLRQAQVQSTNVSSFLTINDKLQNQLELFWKLEDINEKRQWTQEEIECEKQFKDTVTRNEEGRFIVGLPRKNKFELGDSQQGAIKRFESIERRLAYQPEIKEQYIQFMQTYENLEHMSKIEPESNETNKVVNPFYLLHHHVIKKDSLTTKLRVVFDGSFKSTSGNSLNNELLVGPNVQEDLFNIVLRFRIHAYVLTADIKMMFRQILIKEEDRHLQRIIWREDTNKELQEYNLNTVTYGTACAPFLATRSLKELAEQDGYKFPQAKAALLNDFYMDDVLTGANTIDEAVQLQQQLTNLLNQGKFELRKWRTNNNAILSHLTEEDKSNQLLVVQEQDSLKTLGILWNSSEDTINFNIRLDNNSKITKRTILGQIAQIFDPLGLIGPVTIRAKIIMQTLWQLKTEWDEEVPEEVYNDWIQYRLSLPIINHLQIERNVNPGNKDQQIDIHGFCDASTIAYGACVYVTSMNKTQEQTTRLLCAKARVAPLKIISLPRLELCGAIILAKLIAAVKQSLKDKVRNIYLWSDSTIVLNWIKTPSNLLKTFVANRVTEIQKHTSDATWQHVNSLENPADIISRGENAEQLIQNKLWWFGPNWLQTNNWPKQINHNEDPILELKTNTMLVIHQEELSLLTKYSSWNKLLRVVSYMQRFIRNTRQRDSRKFGMLDATELNTARKTIVRLVQEQGFAQEIQVLKRRGIVTSKSRILNLNPFLDDQGLIRVGGRLNNADITIDQKHPYLLPAKHYVTDLIIQHEHKKLHHCGQEQLLAVVRLKYWPIAGRQAVKRNLQKCHKCFRFKPKIPDHLMGNLPSPRVKGYTRPFTICGIDYAGPLQLKPHNRRGKYQVIKAYVAVFVCFSTKAVHIELISDLTTEAFLAALRRFTSRRGICKEIYSDNATNFTGANNKLKEIYEFLQNSSNVIDQDLQARSIQWHFIPPRGPHFGGLWEAAVKATKRHLYTVTQGVTLTIEECTTLLTEIEAILNSRPLIPLSASPNDLVPITPAHFLIGDSLIEPVSYVYKDVPDNSLSRWQHLQKIKQHFWRRWCRDYLHCLQQRTRWQRTTPNIEPGTLVVLIEDNVPPLRWPMGRILETFPGNDGIVRVVSVRTSSGVLKRPVKRVCVLPSEGE